jgi:flagellar biosynthesis chaperone FliJ
MANKVDAKLTDLGNKRTAKVKEIRKLEAKLTPSGIPDAERKSLNTQLNKLNAEREKIESEYNRFEKVASTAKEYIKLNSELKKVQDSITRAEARGEDATDFRSRRSTISERISNIAPEVERVFPEIKVTPLAQPDSGTAAAPKDQATAASAAALGLPASDLTRPSTPVEKLVRDTAIPKAGTTPKGDTGGTGGDKTPPPLTDAEQREQALDVAAGQDFALPETIFNNVPSLKKILNRYVKENWTPDKLRKAIRDDVWYRKNSAEIKARYVQLYNYRDLVATGQADGSTDYEKQISTLERQIADKARQVGSGIASDPAALRKAAENMYITNVGIDDAMTTDFIAAAIRPIGSTIGGQPTEGYSGQALKDYQAIQDIARSNGFSVKDIVPGGQTEQQVLQGIATGKIDPNRLAQDARKLAAQGQPQYVRDLLGQGYNLDQVFAPYRQTMANLLELNADQIDLNDPTLRTAITDKGDMNVYDFKRTLKADKRWQYTENAKQEVSDAALKVLRDFGFQG